MSSPKDRATPLRADIFCITTQAPGALANGTRIAKVKAEVGDGHALGALGTVAGSVGPFPELGGSFGYFITWDDAPTVPVFVAGWKIAPA